MKFNCYIQTLVSILSVVLCINISRAQVVPVMNSAKATTAVTLATIHPEMVSPVNNSRTAGVKSGTRSNVVYNITLEARIAGVDDTSYYALNFRISYWKVYVGKWDRVDNDIQGNRNPVTGNFTAQLDVTKILTTNDCPIYISPYIGGAVFGTQSTVHVLKGKQIEALMGDGTNGDYNSWVHFPYHYGGKGMYYCPHTQYSSANCADGSLDHDDSRLSETAPHPSGNTYHGCCLDCGGLVQQLYRQVGLEKIGKHGGVEGLGIGKPANLQADVFPQISRQNLQLGDIVHHYNHIMIYAGYGDAVFEAPGNGQWTKRTEDRIDGGDDFSGPSALGIDMW